MARFIYIADTHLGADPMGYQMQEGHPEQLPVIVRALQDLIDAIGGIDFVLHGGDMIDAASEAAISQAAEVFQVSVPTFLCLGNHDLTHERSLEMWLRLASGFFPDGQPEYTVHVDSCAVHVAPNHWEAERPYYWGTRQEAHFRPEQIHWLSRSLAATRESVSFVATHSPGRGLPVEQTGLDESHHAPPTAFQAELSSLVAGHPHLACVLGAHSHMNMRVQDGGVQYVTVSSLSEVPFECKLFEVDAGTVTLSTHTLAVCLDFAPRYDFDRTYVQGRPCDRAFISRAGVGG